MRLISKRTARRRAQRGAFRNAIGRSRGGRTTKIHAPTDAVGRPVAFLLTPGNIADTAFDADTFRAPLAARGATAVIPSNRSRAQAVAHDPELYNERHLVECFINKIKHFRRIATRYDKTVQAFMSMIRIACMMVWLR